METRITAWIKTVESTLKKVDKAKQATLSEALRLDLSEVVGWQTAQAEAHAGGTLSTEDAQVIYHAIGPTGANWQRQTLATRLVITQVMQTLLGSQITARRKRA
jgi:hypothetical protein|tara:strand:- start:2431 stop:2742 length:312 start_codon:yes stop_codon:yes gene_type:complete